jgi:DNA-binding response OmpR family regulator
MKSTFETIYYLEKKNYEVTTCNNGLDAITIFEENNFDIF